METASVVIAAAAALFAGLTWLDGRRQAKAARIASESSAQDAGRAADAAERMAAAAERQADLSTEEANRYEIPWRVTRAQGSTFRLTNTNPKETAYYVRLTPVDARHRMVMGTGGRQLAEIDLGPGEAIDFYGLHPHDEVADSRVRVQWRRAPDVNDEQPWTYTTFSAVSTQHRVRAAPAS